MFEMIALKPATMNKISSVTGESIAELEVKYMNALESNRLVVYTVHAWSEERYVHEA